MKHIPPTQLCTSCGHEKVFHGKPCNCGGWCKCNSFKHRPLTRRQQECLTSMKKSRIIGTIKGVVSWNLRWEDSSCTDPLPLWITIRSLIARRPTLIYQMAHQVQGECRFSQNIDDWFA